MKIIDQHIRERFIHEHTKNFSVIAPAGVGKTTAITQRIASIVVKKSIPLEDLIVVTYTNKAADELRDRTMFEVQNGGNFSQDCSKIFFGTIHSLGESILRKYGHYIGLSNAFSIEKNEQRLFENFLTSFDALNELDDSNLRPFLNIDRLRALALNPKSSNLETTHAEKPILQLDRLLNYNENVNENIKNFQKSLNIWLSNKENLPFPSLTSKSKEFNVLYEDTIQSTENWVAAKASQYIKKLCHLFENFRIQNAQLTFHDLIKLSQNALNYSPQEGRQKYIILDEAQDTDPEQFQLLLTMAGIDNNTLNHDGHFSMVGDPQQAIYSARADVNYYQNLHRKLIRNGTLEELKFETTMRFGPDIARQINQNFGSLLDGQNGQVKFSSITSGIENLSRQSWTKLTTNNQSDGELLSSLFSQKTPAEFSVKNWSEIAILCPRKSWLAEIKAEIEKNKNVPKIQLHSNTARYCDTPMFAWLTAIISVLLQPTNDFEFSGILREIFAISDDLIALHFNGTPQNDIKEIQLQFIEFYEKNQSSSPLNLVHNILESFHFSDRLRPEQKASLHFDVFSVIIQCAANCESHEELLDQLLLISQEEIQINNIDEDALQFYTFHKAKGLEWPLVIIPFVNRLQNDPTEQYPRIVDRHIAINQRQFKNLSDPFAISNNAKRLLYVALTRQKMTTIFIEDQSTIGHQSIGSFLNGTNELLSSLPLFEFSQNPPISVPNFSVPHVTVNAYVNEDISIDRLNLDEYLPASTPSTVYKNWWYNLMNSCDFKAQNCKTLLLNSAANAPDISTARENIEKLVENDKFWDLINNASEILKQYNFLVKTSPQTGFEGSIDLLLKNENDAVIINWIIEPFDEESKIKDIYLQKTKNLCTAMKEIEPQLKISPYIYCCNSGKLIKL